MRRLSDTIERLASFKAMSQSQTGNQTKTLTDLGDFGSNPGGLNGRLFVPDDLPANAPLVVVLHGCTQTAEGYDAGSGWSALARQAGFALLYPEQTRANNANLCFNWFQPTDVARDRGEALSIRQMIDVVIARHGTDPSRVFVTGLSAGGAMAAAMLASYPELFAGGAIIAGLAYGSAATIPEAFDRMRGHGGPSADDLQTLLRRASNHPGPWPTISVWQGDADRTVAATNRDRIVDQWRAVHGLGSGAGEVEAGEGFTRHVWRDASGRIAVESTTIPGMGHGTPLDTLGDGLGEAGPFMLEAGISSTREIARAWGLIDGERAMRVDDGAARPLRVEKAPSQAHADQAGPDASPSGPSSVGSTIETALRAAGLMR